MPPLLTGRSAKIPEGVGIKSDFSFAELRIPGNIVCDAEILLGLHLLHPWISENSRWFAVLFFAEVMV